MLYSVIGPDGKTYGPADMSTLQQWCVEGRIVPTTRIYVQLTGEVRMASDFPELMKHFPYPGPPGHLPGPPGMGGQQPPGYAAPNPAMGQGYSQQLPSYGQAGPASPYPRGGYLSGAPIMEPPKNRTIAILLAFFLGVFGIHRFYTGKHPSAIAMLAITLVTCGYGGVITGLWSLIDIVLIASGNFKDGYGRELTW